MWVVFRFPAQDVSTGCKKTAGIRGRLVGDKDCDSITVGEHMLEASD